MIGATLFSGIGAPETAMPHWHWAWSAEFEKFPSAVHAARHPQSVNLGDVTAHDFCERAAAVARPDIIVFGSPCQSFSIAGKRLGMDDPRGNLALVALGIIARLAPRWFTFENVPGLLSSAEGSDFGIFLRAVDELGYSLAWTVLDAQHFGVAQRRERVFAVGYLVGDWRGPAAVLFEPEGLCGHHPPRREARQAVAGSLGAGSKRSGGRVGRREAAAGHLIAGSLGTRSAAHPAGVKSESEFLVAFNNTGQGWWNDSETACGLRDMSAGSGSKEATLVAHALNAHGGSGRIDYESETFVTHALTANGFDAGEDGTGRGTPIIPINMQVITRHEAMGRGTGFGMGSPGDPAYTLSKTHQHAIAFSSKDYGADAMDDCAPTLRAGTHDKSHANAGVPPAIVVRQSAVRRLTPRECERLQGYPDDFTLITYRGKPAADGPRYKALGNSMAVPVMNWILTRIDHVDSLRLAA